MGALKGVVPYEQWEINNKLYQLGRTSEVIPVREPSLDAGSAEDGGRGGQKYAVQDGGEVREGEAQLSSGGVVTEEWIIVNTSPGLHPFHIHVNPFQIKDVITNNEGAYSPDAPAGSGGFYDSVVTNQGITVNKETGQRESDMRWRDTVLVPPGGSVHLWMRFDARNPLRLDPNTGSPVNAVGSSAGVTQPAGVFTGKTVYHCHFLTHEDLGMIENFVLTKAGPDTTSLVDALDSSGHVKQGIDCGPEGGCTKTVTAVTTENSTSSTKPPKQRGHLRGGGRGAS